MGLVSGLSLANHSDSESFLVAQYLLSKDRYQWEGFWEVVGRVMSPFELSLTLLVGDGLLVLCSLPGPPIIKWLMWMVTREPGQGGRFQSVCCPYQGHKESDVTERLTQGIKQWAMEAEIHSFYLVSWTDYKFFTAWPLFYLSLYLLPSSKHGNNNKS